MATEELVFNDHLDHVKLGLGLRLQFDGCQDQKPQDQDYVQYHSCQDQDRQHSRTTT